MVPPQSPHVKRMKQPLRARTAAIVISDGIGRMKPRVVKRAVLGVRGMAFFLAGLPTALFFA